MRNGRVRGLRAVIAVVVAAACCGVGALRAAPADAAELGDMRIGSKNLVGADLLSQLYGQALAAEGAQVTFLPDLGPTETTFQKLRQGDFEAYGEYQGTLLEYLGGMPSHSSERTHAALQAKLQPLGLTATTPAPAVDVNGFYVTRKAAKRFNLTTISDLKRVDQKLVFGGPPECADRPLCLGTTEQDLYGLRFKSVKKLDTGGPVTRAALVSGRIDVGILFTGSSVIPHNAVLLRDDRGLQPADNPILVVRTEAATPKLVAVVDSVSEQVTTAAYRQMSLDISIRNHDPADVAATFLSEHNLP
jgi:osmoprotectant transport system substrate-binding protein